MTPREANKVYDKLRELRIHCIKNPTEKNKKGDDAAQFSLFDFLEENKEKQV